MDTLLAQEEERRIETESILQCANLEIESLQAKVEAAGRAQSEQQSKVSLQLECARQDLQPEQEVANAAHRQLRDLHHKTTVQVRELEAQVRAHQAEATAAQHALQLVEAEHSQACSIPWEDFTGCRKVLHMKRSAG